MTITEGIHTQTNSFRIVVAPAELKKASPIGDETIGRHGRKNRAELNGAKKATPNVPSTMASRPEWEAVAAKKNANSARRLIIPLTGFLKASSTTSPLTTIAKKNECVSPRWPSIVVWSKPNRLAKISISGATAQTEDNTQNRRGSGRVVYARPKAIDATA